MSDHMLRQRLAVAISLLYLVSLLAVYLYIPFGNPGYEYGGIRLFLYTLPWSFLGQMIPAALSDLLPVTAFKRIEEAVAFLSLVVLCGGANAWLLLRASGVKIKRLHLYALGVMIVFLGVGLQATAAARARMAIEYHRPRNVPKNAFVQPSVAGWWWQSCQYDSMRSVNRCQIWNLAGKVLYDEEFVPYDGGPPAKLSELRILERNGGPDRVPLKNGRILIPKSRRAELTRFLNEINSN